MRQWCAFISVIKQLDAQNVCFTVSLFHASTCFEHMCSNYVEAWNKLTVKQNFCASSWLITEINALGCTVSKTPKKWCVCYLKSNKMHRINDYWKRFLFCYSFLYCVTTSIRIYCLTLLLCISQVQGLNLDTTRTGFLQTLLTFFHRPCRGIQGKYTFITAGFSPQIHSNSLLTK